MCQRTAEEASGAGGENAVNPQSERSWGPGHNGLEGFSLHSGGLTRSNSCEE